MGWLAGILFCFPGMAQVSDFHFRQLSLEAGLSQSSVFAIVQDDDGFMWFGTQDGLNQYDGYGFRVHKKRPFDSTSLSHSHVRALIKDRTGNLWIGTASGLNLLDKRNNRFLNLSHLLNHQNDAEGLMVNCLYEDAGGTIWVGTARGLSGIVPIREAGKTVRYRTFHARYDEKESGSLSSNHVLSLLEDRNGNVWIGTASGINLLSKDSLDRKTGNQIRSFRNQRNSPEPMYNLEGRFISAMVQDTFGHLWVGTGRGLYQIDPVAARPVAHYTQDSDTDAPGKRDRVSPMAHTLLSNQVYSLLFDSQGVLWAGTLGGGIHKLLLNEEGKVDRIVQLRQRSIPGKEAKNDFVLCIYESREKNDGTMWFGLEAGGVAQFNPSKNNFKLYRRNELSDNTLSGENIFSVLKDREGFLWIGTSHGLNRYDARTQRYTRYFYEPENDNTLSANQIFKLLEDREGNLWVGTSRGLNRYDRRNDQFIRVNMLVDGKPVANVGTITALCEDSERQLWVGASYDLIKLDRSTLKGVSYGYHAKNAARITGGRITTIYEDQQKNLWIGTYAGLNRYDRQANDFIHYPSLLKDKNSLSSNTVLSMLQDHNGAYWIATDLGLNKLVFEGKKAIFTHYMEKDGLPNNFIYGVLEDEAGRIWMSTNMGLSVYDPRNGTFTNYDEADGLQSKEFNSGAYFRAENGEMFFGGIQGLNSFFPDNMRVNRHVPKVRIVALERFEVPVNLDSLRLASDVLTFDYTENYFSFEFVSLDYANPSKNKYAYQLEGFDKDWIHCGNRRYASFTNLDPGDYVFKVKGSNDNGIWNESAIASIRIRIKPPFWQTWWFYVLSLAAVVLAVKLIHDLRVRRKLKRLLELEKIRTTESEKIRKQTASDFHDEMGNRITRIGVLTELIKVQLNNSSTNGDYGGEVTSLLSKISENCNTLYNGTRDFIWSINPDNNTFYEVAVRLKDFGDELFDNTAVNFQVGEISEHYKEVKLPMDWSRQLILIFKEALNNTLKHSHCRNVYLQFSVQEGDALISLTDDGQGFEPGNGRGGTGLKNMTTRARKINSQLQVSSEKSTGTKIIFSGTLPQNGGVLI